MAALPKNISIVSYKNAKGSKQVKYRVRLQVKGEAFTQLFDELPEAKVYLAEIKSRYGRKALSEQEEADARALEEFKQPTLDWFFDTYFDYKYPQPRENDSLLKKKQHATYKSFFKTILNTEIQVFNEKTLIDAPQASEILNRYGFGSSISKNKKFGKLKLHEINYKIINAYIRRRLELGKSKITVRKEISIISCFFSEIKHIATIPEKFVENTGNPTKDIDKKLLAKPKTIEKAKRIDDDNFEKLKNCINIEPLDFAYVVLLQYFGAFRMSEAIYLEWKHINFETKQIFLPQTKTNPRLVYMTKDLQDLLETIEEDESKRTGVVLKTQTIYKYQKQIQRFRVKYGFELVTHQLRKDAIGRMIDKVGNENSIVLAEILGFSNVKNFESNYLEDDVDLNTIEGVMKNIGHAEKSKNITKKIYYALPKFKKH